MRDALVPHLAADAQQTSSAAQPIDESVAIIHTIPEKNLARVIDYLPLTSRVAFMVVDKGFGRKVLATTDTVQLIARLIELGISEFNILNLIRDANQDSAKLTLLKLLEKAELITGLASLNKSYQNAVTGLDSAYEYLNSLYLPYLKYLIKGNVNHGSVVSVEVLKCIALSGVDGALLRVTKEHLMRLSDDALYKLIECAAYSGNLENFKLTYQWLKDRRDENHKIIGEDDKWLIVNDVVLAISIVSAVALTIALFATYAAVGNGLTVNLLIGFMSAAILVCAFSVIKGLATNEKLKKVTWMELPQHVAYLKHAALSGNKELFTYLLTESNEDLKWSEIKDYALKGGNVEIIKILNEKIAANPRVEVSNINANRMVATSEASRAWAAENRLRSQNNASRLVHTLWGSSADKAVAATNEPQGTVAVAVRRGPAN